MMTPAFVEFLGTGLLVSAFAFGSPILVVAALAAAIGFGGRISGGHFNPAITAYSWMTGRMSQSKALMYMGAQIAAGLAVGLLRGM